MLTEKPKSSPVTCACGSTNLERTLTPHLMHHSKLTCRDCGRFVRWLPMPKNEQIDIKRKQNSRLLKTFGKGFCSVCRRSELELPGRVCLEAHHIIPIKDGGTDDKGNLLEVCSDCHKLIHHIQRTFNAYQSDHA